MTRVSSVKQLSIATIVVGGFGWQLMQAHIERVDVLSSTRDAILALEIVEQFQDLSLERLARNPKRKVDSLSAEEDVPITFKGIGWGNREDRFEAGRGSLSRKALLKTISEPGGSSTMAVPLDEAQSYVRNRLKSKQLGMNKILSADRFEIPDNSYVRRIWLDFDIGTPGAEIVTDPGTRELYVPMDEERLLSVKERLGIDAYIKDDLPARLFRQMQKLERTQVSLGGQDFVFGLSAISWILPLTYLFLLVLIRNRLSTLESGDLEDPWIVVDGRSPLEMLTIAGWIGSLFMVGWIVAACLIFSVRYDIGTIKPELAWKVVMALAAIAIVICTMWVFVTMVAQMVRLRVECRAVSSTATGPQSPT